MTCRGVCVLLILSCVAPRAWAQEPLPSASVLHTQSPAALSETAGAVDRLLRARLDRLGVVRVIAGVALDLGEVQLALGCMGETPECLGAITEQLHADRLVLPSLDRVGNEVVLGILVFDAGDHDVSRVVRRAHDEVELLDTIEGALRELFDLPAVSQEPEQIEPGGGAGGQGSERQPIPASGPDLLAPAFLLVGGGAIIVGGAIAGALFLDASSTYAALPTDTPAQATHAAQVLTDGNAYGLASTVLFVGGAVVAAAGLVWLGTALSSSSSTPRARLMPLLSPTFAGLSIEGGFR